MKKHRTLEQNAITRMKLFAHWLECWEEDVKSEDPYPSLMDSSFGLLQLRDLQKVLTRLEAKLQEFERQN